MSATSQERKLALPKEAEHWSLTTLRDKAVKIGAKIVRHGRYITFQLAEVAVSRQLFAEMLQLISGLRPDRGAQTRGPFGMTRGRSCGRAPP